MEEFWADVGLLGTYQAMQRKAARKAARKARKEAEKEAAKAQKETVKETVVWRREEVRVF